MGLKRGNTGGRGRLWWYCICWTERALNNGVDKFWFAEQEARWNNWVHFSKFLSQSLSKQWMLFFPPVRDFECALAPGLVILFFKILFCVFLSPSTPRYNYSNPPSWEEGVALLPVCFSSLYYLLGIWKLVWMVGTWDMILVKTTLWRNQQW